MMFLVLCMNTDKEDLVQDAAVRRQESGHRTVIVEDFLAGMKME